MYGDTTECTIRPSFISGRMGFDILKGTSCTLTSVLLYARSHMTCFTAQCTLLVSLGCKRFCKETTMDRSCFAVKRKL